MWAHCATVTKRRGSKFCRKSVGVRNGRPATLLNAMLKRIGVKLLINYQKCLHKGRHLRIRFDSAVTETLDNKKFLKLFKNFNITATEHDINKFVVIDDESSYFFLEK